MKLTNKQNLPDALVAAVANDSYSRGDADLSVTQLISPPRQVELRRIHEDAIEEDAADRIWSLVGQVGHGILERSDATGVGSIRERRLFAEIDGMKISGSFDHLAVDDETLSDYKFVSVWSVRNAADKTEWITQLNCYAYLASLHDLKVSKLQIIAICRDWSKREAERDQFGTYPQKQVAVIPIPLWSQEQTLAYIRSRIALHKAARTELPPCSKEDRWQRDDQWAVMKKGLKRAVKLYNNEAEAVAAVAESPLLSVEARPGEPIRCRDYCAVSKFCTQYNAELEAA